MTYRYQMKHCTEIHPRTGTGQNDCGQCALARYLGELAKVRKMAGPEWALVYRWIDPADVYGYWDLIDHLSELARGTHDLPGNLPTTLGQVVRMFTAFGITATWVAGQPSAYQAAYSAAWALCWVDGLALAPATWPRDFIPESEAGDGNHFTLWMPDGKTNDPLSYPDAVDALYSTESQRAAIYGCWVLPTIAESDAQVSELRHVQGACALKSRPDHGPDTLANLPAHAAVELTGKRTPNWVEVSIQGWVLADNV